MKIDKLKKKIKKIEEEESQFIYTRNVIRKYVFRMSKMAPNALPHKYTD